VTPARSSASPQLGIHDVVEGVAEEHLHLAAITLAELQAGVEITRERDPKKADEIEAWIDKVGESHDVLPMDGPTLRRWAKLMHHRSDDLIEDAMIAATALVHDLTVVTRKLEDFRPFRVRTLNPFTAAR
jgi:toxin FitB